MARRLAGGEEVPPGGRDERAAEGPGRGHRINRPRSRAAPSTQFRSSMAMVIGPTPPGTGVRCEAVAAQLAKSTSPTSRYPRFFEASSTALIPTSMTTAPGFSQAPCTYSAIPHAATTMSASRIRAGASASGRPRRWLQQGGRGGPHDAAAADNERPACPRSRRRSSGPREGSTRSSRYLSLQSSRPRTGVPARGLFPWSTQIRLD